MATLVYPWVFGRSRKLSLNKFFDTSTPSMRKVDDGKKKEKKECCFQWPLTSLPVGPRTPTDWNAARSCQYYSQGWHLLQSIWGLATYNIINQTYFALTPSESHSKWLKYGKDNFIIACYHISGRLAGGQLNTYINCIN